MFGDVFEIKYFCCFFHKLHSSISIIKYYKCLYFWISRYWLIISSSPIIRSGFSYSLCLFCCCLGSLAPAKEKTEITAVQRTTLQWRLVKCHLPLFLPLWSTPPFYLCVAQSLGLHISQNPSLCVGKQRQMWYHEYELALCWILRWCSIFWFINVSKTTGAPLMLHPFMKTFSSAAAFVTLAHS